jgi:quercetin dioxygenase-like cupin family protein
MSSVSWVDTAALALDGRSGAIWSLPHGGDLDANVVVLHPGDAVGAHVNDEVDVLVIGLAGAGVVTVDDGRHPLQRGALVHVPKSCERAITVEGEEPLVYVTVHRARAGLGIHPRRSS